MLITVGIKQLAIFFLNRQSFSAFYRKNPALANVVNVAFECWHIFLSIAFVISRAVILIFVSLIFIGRVDRTVLAEDIGEDVMLRFQFLRIFLQNKYLILLSLLQNQ